jgi:polysaccharide pyruvyl transferase WcaK-like protein
LQAATVRDERSRELFAPLVPATPVERTADPVLLYEPPESPVDLEAAGLGPASDPLVVVCVRKTTAQSELITAVSTAVDHLAVAHGARVAFVPFGGVADAELSTAIIRKCRSQPMLLALDGLDAVAAAIARAKLVIGVRLHALILAVRFGIPFLAIPYDPKVTGLIDDIGYPIRALWTPGTKFDPVRASALVDDVWTRRDELAETVSVAAADQRRLAARNFDVLRSLVYD